MISKASMQQAAHQIEEAFRDVSPDTAEQAVKQPVKENFLQRVAKWWNTPIENTALFEAETPDNHDMGAQVSYVRERTKKREIDETLKGFAQEQDISVDELRGQFPEHSDEYIFRRLLGLRVSKNMK